MRTRPGRGRRLAALGVLAGTVLPGGLLGSVIGSIADGQPAAAATIGAHSAPGGDLPTVYAQDLVARINADRAARTTAAQPVPALVPDAAMAAAAQAWSVTIAAAGTVADPPLATCTGPNGTFPTPAQLCTLAANAGRSGTGFWPGDGSDGMENAYMASAGHRENMLNAGYTTVGVGVTCRGNQAWTVELFGFTYGDLAPAQSRQAAQDATEGNPVPADPVAAGTATGLPVYCPGQVIGTRGTTTATGGQYPYPYPVPAVPGEPGTTQAGAGQGAVVGIAASAGATGYWVAAADGAVSAHGSAPGVGSMAGRALAAPIRHIVATADGQGYWLVAGDGGIFAFGDAAFFGSMGGQHLNAPVVALAPTRSGQGYWLVAGDGGIFAFGDAAFFGSMGGQHLNAPVVGAESASTDPMGGYWLVASDGGIFAFGAASFRGSMGGQRLNEPIVGMAANADGAGGGYWEVASDGGIFAFAAPFHGSTGALALVAPITAMALDPGTGGYWLVAADGGVFAFAAPFYGAG